MWRLKSGEVVVDRHNSHLSGKNGVGRFLSEALGRIESAGREFFIEEVDFGQVIGEIVCVATRPGDRIIYAKRPKRFGYSRFVMDRMPEPCSTLVVILKAGDFDQYVLITAFVGKRPQPEPWDVRNFSQQPNPQEAERLAREFWGNHALIWGAEEIIHHTISTDCPW